MKIKLSPGAKAQFAKSIGPGNDEVLFQFQVLCATIFREIESAGTANWLLKAPEKNEKTLAYERQIAEIAKTSAALVKQIESLGVQQLVSGRLTIGMNVGGDLNLGFSEQEAQQFVDQIRTLASNAKRRIAPPPVSRRRGQHPKPRIAAVLWRITALLTQAHPDWGKQKLCEETVSVAAMLFAEVGLVAWNKTKVRSEMAQIVATEAEFDQRLRADREKSTQIVLDRLQKTWGGQQLPEKVNSTIRKRAAE